MKIKPKGKKRVFSKVPKPLKGQGVQYFRKLKGVVNQLTQAVKEEILQPLKARKSEFVGDGLGVDIINAMQRLKGEFIPSIGLQAAMIAVPEINNTVKKNKAVFEKNVSSAVGVNIEGIIAEEGLGDFVETQIAKNVSLIKNLPEQYLNQVEVIVTNGINNGLRFEEISKQLRSANISLTNRAKLIARNEMSNITSQLNKKRSENLGVQEFIWQTSEDEKVRGNPGGLYPNARPSHFALNGKTFSWKKGAKTVDGRIWPGGQINCRCVALNIIEP